MADEAAAPPFDDLISRIKDLRGDLRPAEARVADVVLDDVEFAVRASNGKLAQAAGVSEPTVTRFCRTLGCDGVRDFKLKLAQSLVVGAIYFRTTPDVKARTRLWMAPATLMCPTCRAGSAEREIA